MLSLNEAVRGEFAEQYLEAITREFSSLISHNTWNSVPLSDANNVIKSKWAFKLKRLPDGTPSKFKERFCVRGDLQKEGVVII